MILLIQGQLSAGLGQPRIVPMTPSANRVVTEATGITPDPRYFRVRDPDMALGNSLDLDVTMAPGGSSGLPDQSDPSSSIVLRH